MICSFGTSTKASAPAVLSYIRVIIIEKVSNACILCVIGIYSVFLFETCDQCGIFTSEASLQVLGLVSYHNSYLMYLMQQMSTVILICSSIQFPVYVL